MCNQFFLFVWLVGHLFMLLLATTVVTLFTDIACCFFAIIGPQCIIFCAVQAVWNSSLFEAADDHIAGNFAPRLQNPSNDPSNKSNDIGCAEMHRFLHCASGALKGHRCKKSARGVWTCGVRFCTRPSSRALRWQESQTMKDGKEDDQLWESANWWAHQTMQEAEATEIE